MKLIYITSLGFSGSTLVDLVTSAHSRTFSVGEVINVREYAHVLKEKNKVSAYGNECTCGTPTIWECPFWKNVEKDLKESSDLSLKDLDFRDYESPDYARHNAAMLESVAKVAGVDVIVDSSKAPRRLEALLDNDLFEVIPVHLVRHPRGMVYSQIKRGRSALKISAHFTRRTLQIRRLLGDKPHTLVRYERFVEDPKSHIEPVMRAAGLDWEDSQLEWAARERHNLGGNPMRRSTDSTIRLDTTWKDELRTRDRLLIDAITLPAMSKLRKSD